MFFLKDDRTLGGPRVAAILKLIHFILLCFAAVRKISSFRRGLKLRDAILFPYVKHHYEKKEIDRIPYLKVSTIEFFKKKENKIIEVKGMSEAESKKFLEENNKLDKELLKEDIVVETKKVVKNFIYGVLSAIDFCIEAVIPPYALIREAVLASGGSLFGVLTNINVKNAKKSDDYNKLDGDMLYRL